MQRLSGEVAILGAGFAGTILALVLAKMGRSVVVIERGQHPRFAIGESSTPLAGLALEELARHYALPELLPLCKYGTWQRHYPHLACGLKRGFSYFHHAQEAPYVPRADRRNELLVAASPDNESSDTHWFRAEFDHFLVQQMQTAGIPYLDQCEISHIQRDRQWCLTSQRLDQPIEIVADFLVDASGPGGVLAQQLGIDCSPVGLRTRSWSLYSHFEHVEPWQSLYTAWGGSASEHPFPCDDAALHHVFADGWMWQLRFNNGITSAGFAFNSDRVPEDQATPVDVQWQQRMSQYPSVARQFHHARACRPLVRSGRLQRRARQVVGPGWAMLGHAAYFLDPLFSPGIAHTLTTVERLAKLLQQHWRKDSLQGELQHYARQLQGEIDHVDRILHGCYSAFDRFPLFVAFAMFYFAGAIESEERRRGKRPGPATGFLLAHEEDFRDRLARRYEHLLQLLEQPEDYEAEQAFAKQVAIDLAPWNSAGLCDPIKNNLYPYIGSTSDSADQPSNGVPTLKSS